MECKLIKCQTTVQKWYFWVHPSHCPVVLGSGIQTCYSQPQTVWHIDWVNSSVKILGKNLLRFRMFIVNILPEITSYFRLEEKNHIWSVFKAKKNKICTLPSLLSLPPPPKPRKVWQGNIGTRKRKKTSLCKQTDRSVTLFPLFMSCYQISRLWKAISWCRELEMFQFQVYLRRLQESHPFFTVLCLSRVCFSAFTNEKNSALAQQAQGFNVLMLHNYVTLKSYTGHTSLTWCVNSIAILSNSLLFLKKNKSFRKQYLGFKSKMHLSSMMELFPSCTSELSEWKEGEVWN